MERIDASRFWREMCGRLSAVSQDAVFEARQIMKRLTGKDFPPDQELSRELCGRLSEAVVRREAGEPLQYILGEWDFYGRTFRVGPGVLIPRADTETLVEAALGLWQETVPPLTADLCSGSGCLAATMALETGGQAFAVEKSPEAICYLRENIERLDAPVTVCEDDVLCPIGEYPLFDMILSNPPYLTEADMASLQTEVRQEPEMALAGGEDGLDFYRAIPGVWKKRLKPGGWLLFEIGRGQEKAVEEILWNDCFKNVCFFPDLCGIIRVTGGRYMPPGHNS